MFEQGEGYPGITLVARFLTPPPGGPWPVPLYLAGIRSGPIVFYQFLGFTNVNFPYAAYFTSAPLPVSARFPFGFDVEPD